MIVAHYRLLGTTGVDFISLAEQVVRTLKLDCESLWLGQFCVAELLLLTWIGVCTVDNLYISFGDTYNIYRCVTGP